MNVLVTGGAGYIGSHTVTKLLAAGHQPLVYDNLSNGFAAAVPDSVKLVVGDVQDSAHLAQIMKGHQIEAVIHFAAKLVVPESVEKPLAYYENNVLGTLKVLEACGLAGVSHMIFSSTGAVYGNSMQVTETATPAPLSPYGMSKLMSEQVLVDFAKARALAGHRKFSYVILRYFNVAGAAAAGGNGQRTKNATHLVKVASEAICGKRHQVEVFGTDYPTADGTGVRDYIHVDDLADAHVRALDYLAAGGASDIFNVGYGRGYSVREVLQTMKKVAGKDFVVKESPRRAGDAAAIVADPSKIRRVLGWTARHEDLEFICRTALNWERGE